MHLNNRAKMRESAYKLGMKKASLIFLLLSLLTLTGCMVASVHPLYTKKDLIFDPSLVGTWVDKKDKTTLTFVNASDGTYKVVSSDNKSKKEESVEYVDVRLLKLKDQEFLDVYFSDPNYKNESLPKKYHFFVKISRNKDMLTIAIMNGEWLQELLKQNPDAISHKGYMKENVLLAAQTKELQSFVMKYANSKDAWVGGTPLIRESSNPFVRLFQKIF